MSLKEVLHFLEDLSHNNNRDWMQENKSRYKMAKTTFESFINDLLLRLTELDPDIQGLLAKDCTFRINRDIRFSKDKSPYKTNFGAYMAKGGKKSHNPGYYIHFQPGNTFIGGGAYMPEAEPLAKIRQEIDYNGEAFTGILHDKDFKSYFGDLQGEQLKTSPKGYANDHPNIEWLRYKSFFVMHYFSDDEVSGEGFLDEVLLGLEKSKPLKDYLDMAIND